jgi:protoheme IX farnesyltransferase
MNARTTVAATSVVADYLTLLKLRIASFVGLSAFVGGLLGASSSTPTLRIGEAALWVTLAAGAASAFNQVLERDTDRLMERTRNRPLPSGRIAPRDAILFASILATISIAALGFRFNALAAALALATLFSYVAVYTPLKRYSTLNTIVGAVPGAAPPLLGYAALAGTVQGWAWVLFAIVFVWQFPHFMAIAWLYRHDYARAGLRMLPTEPGGERVAGRAAITYALVLVPVSLLPGVWGDAGRVFVLGATVLALAYAATAVRFALRQDRGSARLLLFTSLAYLPLVLLLVVLDPVTGVIAAHGWR